MNLLFPEIIDAKPFLKWAGGKGQLLKDIEAALPSTLADSKDFVYIEPFIGSGAVLFWLLKHYPSIKHAVINDINKDLTIAYNTIKSTPYELIKALKQLQKTFYSFLTEEQRRDFFNQKRNEFNERNLSELQNTSLLIFLNRTCFNGLYRVNGKNYFNVPFGKYERPRICDEENIIAVSALLQRVTILNGDYSATISYATKNAFYYLDPPYKPISKTSSFNAYAKEIFDDEEQIRLKLFCEGLTKKGSKWLLSNSDPKNVNTEDHFFENLYAGSSFYINRVKAKRNINSVASKRGEVSELLISNYVKSKIV